VIACQLQLGLRREKDDFTTTLGFWLPNAALPHCLINVQLVWLPIVPAHCEEFHWPETAAHKQSEYQAVPEVGEYIADKFNADICR